MSNGPMPLNLEACHFAPPCPVGTPSSFNRSANGPQRPTLFPLLGDPVDDRLGDGHRTTELDPARFFTARASLVRWPISRRSTGRRWP
jgi:hypothetical protein